MTVQVTVNLPEDVYQHFHWLSQITGDSMGDIMALLEISQIGMVRKAQGIREAVERGLMKRLDE